MSGGEDPIAGHKTMSDGSHVPLRKSEADARWASAADWKDTTAMRKDTDTPIADEFRGDNALLRSCIAALLDFDARGRIVPHGIGGHARSLLSAAYHRLQAVSKPNDGALDELRRDLEVERRRADHNWRVADTFAGILYTNGIAYEWPQSQPPSGPMREELGVAEFIETIHRLTLNGKTIEVQHHPNGDWSVSNKPVAAADAPESPTPC